MLNENQGQNGNKIVRDYLVSSKHGWSIAFDKDVLIAPAMRLATVHPTIDSPLTLTFSSGFPISWYAGSFFSAELQVQSSAEATIAFLEDFLDEKILHCVAYSEDQVVAVGSVRDSEWSKWHMNFDRIALRSWTGRLDADIIVEPKGLATGN